MKLNILDAIKTQLIEEEPHIKTSFWASDFEKDTLELYLKWKNTPVTNPFSPENMVMFSAGKMIELAIINKLRSLNIVKYPANEEDEQAYFKIEREGVPISGKMDAVITDNKQCSALEIKTFYGTYQEKELMAGMPRTSYLKQLACYMDATDLDTGTIVYMERGSGNMYSFTLRKTGDQVYECTSYDKRDEDGKHPITTTLFMNDEYKRFAQIYQDYVLTDTEPKSDFVYKIPVELVDWRSLSADKISKARNNKAVIGDWQVKYSPYKDLIIAKEAKEYGKTFSEYIGYNDEELNTIHNMTKGYTSKKK